jgi:hypothetical protein
MVFERWVMEAFRLSGAAGHYAYPVYGLRGGQVKEQVDGLVHAGWQGFLVESKFYEEEVPFGPIARLHVLAEQRPVGTLGLFFSASGYTDAAEETAETLRPLRVLLFDRRDLLWALKSERSMLEMVHRKWVLALKYGKPYLPIDEPLDLAGVFHPEAWSVR